MSARISVIGFQGHLDGGDIFFGEVGARGKEFGGCHRDVLLRVFDCFDEEMARGLPAGGRQLGRGLL